MKFMEPPESSGILKHLHTQIDNEAHIDISLALFYRFESKILLCVERDETDLCIFPIC
jgi:hypothetical protein